MRPAGLMLFLALVARSSASAVTVPGDYPTVHDAVASAPDGAVIQIAAGHYHDQISLQNGSRSLTIRGNPADPSSVIIDGDGTTPSVVVIANYSGTLVIEGLTITGGHGKNGYGGGIGVYGASPVFRDCIIKGNTSEEHGGGAILARAAGLFLRCVFRDNTANDLAGGVLLQEGSTTAFEQCQFVDNVAGLVEPHNGGGGGLYIRDSSPTLLGCLVQGNRGKFSGGGIGALTAFDVLPSVLTLQDTVIADNQVIRDPSQADAVGGGMHIEDNMVALLDRCWVHGNVANGGGGLNAYRARYEITDSVIEGNQAIRESSDAGNGGGIFAASANTPDSVHDPAVVVLSRSVVRNNIAEFGGGLFVGGDFALTNMRATLQISDSLVAGNTSASNGGGIWVDRAVTTIARSMILSNVAQGQFGGGITASGSSITTVNDTTIAGNAAASQGGGIFVDGGGELHVAASRLLDNQASSPQGAGGIMVATSPGPITNPPVTGEVTGSVFADAANAEIAEPDCDGATMSAVSYVGNTIHTSAPTIYWRPCAGGVSSVGAFNAIPGKASGNVNSVPHFAAFMATPVNIVAGSGSTLAWYVAGAANPVISPGIGPVSLPAGTVDVTPTARTDYTLSATGVTSASATVEVACGTLGAAVARAPANRAMAQDPSAVTLAWYDATGATSYDVYLDAGGGAPVTPVGRDLTAALLPLGPLASGTDYRWTIVAKAPGCPPAVSPTFGFRTCSISPCSFDDSFSDGGASDWRRLGNGSASVLGGRLVLSSRRWLAAMAPIPPTADATVSLSMQFLRGRRQARVLFAYRDARNFRAFVVSGSGRVMLEERLSGRRRVVARDRRQVPVTRPFTVELDITGGTVSALLDGGQELSGDFGSSAVGTVGVRVARGKVAVDDVHIGPNGM